MWQIISEETGRASSSDDDNMHSNKCNEETLSLANKFNAFFTNVADELTKGKSSSINKAIQYLPPSNYNSNFKHKNINRYDIIKISKNLKNKNSQDMWNMSPKFIKQIIYEIADYLLTIFNNCIEKGVFPDLLKIARVIPIFKKGDKKDLGNYRPISILPVLSKFLEKLSLSNLLTIY
jgi:hypothetical protein